mmetsp:Transcript_16943/g.40409  ORF Transcript_16943/g.40409 Transcript_16943/m.40409 type:complete len:207 (+) Transcript_16943:1964-2584(+)
MLRSPHGGRGLLSRQPRPGSAGRPAGRSRLCWPRGCRARCHRSVACCSGAPGMTRARRSEPRPTASAGRVGWRPSVPARGRLADGAPRPPPARAAGSSRRPAAVWRPPRAPRCIGAERTGACLRRGGTRPGETSFRGRRPIPRRCSATPPPAHARLRGTPPAAGLRPREASPLSRAARGSGSWPPPAAASRRLCRRRPPRRRHLRR